MHYIFIAILSIACTSSNSKTSGERQRQIEMYPMSTGIGTTLEIDFDANTSTFSYADTTVNFGEGVTVEEVNIDDGWSSRAIISVDEDAELGYRDVIINTDGREYVLEDGFELLKDSFIIEPNRAKVGEAVTVNILGKNTEWIGGLTWPHFGDGIEVINFQVYTETLASAEITISTDAIPGWKNVVVDSGSGNYTVVYDSFMVDRIGLAASFDPNLVEQGEVIEFTIRAKDTDFLSSIPEIRFFDRFGENPDIIILDLHVLDAQNMYGRMQSSNAAALGNRDVLIEVDNDSVRIPDAFEVIGGDWKLSEVAINLDFYVTRYLDPLTCEIRENVVASAIFFIPLDPPCGGGSGEPPESPSPYDNNGVFELPESEPSNEDCPFPTTLSAGDYVWFESDVNIVTLDKRYESASGTIYYWGENLHFHDYVPNKMYDLHTQGDPDGIGEYILKEVQPTVPSDWSWLSPNLCGLYHNRSDDFIFEWSPALTYPSAIFGTFIFGTLESNGKSGFAGVYPWDDGQHFFRGGELLQLKSEEVQLQSYSYINGPWFGLPESIYVTKSNSYILFATDFYLD